MERDPYEGGTDVGRDIARDLADEPPAAIRDAPPDILSPIDDSSPVSGHVPPPEKTASPVDLPEHDGRSPGPSSGRRSGRSVRGACRSRPSTATSLAQRSMQSHAQPLIDSGPAGLPVIYTIPAGGFDVVVNGDHLLSWGVGRSSCRTPRCATWGLVGGCGLDRRGIG